MADQLRAYLLAQGVEGIPSSNALLFNMLQVRAQSERLLSQLYRLSSTKTALVLGTVSTCLLAS